MNKSDIFWQTYLNLEKEVIDVSKYIFITDEVTIHCKDGVEKTEVYDAQLKTFSPYIADLLVRCCIQIEAISKELYYENGGTKARGDKNLFFDEDCLKLIDMKWATHNKRVLIVAPFFNLTKEENKVLRPLKEAHKRSGTYWGKAYQAVKHDRFSSLKYGNVKALLHALAALYLLNVYFRNNSWLISIKDVNNTDYSLGSSLFAVKSPEVGQIWYGNNPIQSESPYVISYKADDYKRIKDMQDSDNKALNDYWSKQPELKEADFIAILSTELEKQKQNPSYRIMYIWELAKYRLRKILPKSLPFEERKALFIKSEAWNCWISQNNKHLSPDEITPDNIEKEIESIGINWGIDIEKRFNTMKWIQMAMNDAICEVYIPR